jgi:hypothetical protein
MTYVDAERLELVLAWDRASITLSPDVSSKLEEIGPTPPDVYGNGAERRVTPCAVETSSGEVFELAMICVQPDAPVQAHLNFRLGSDIARVTESSFTLPLDVRRASSQAHEMRMGFYPSLIQMPDGRKFVINGMTSFLSVDGYSAKDARTASGSYFQEQPPPSFVETPKTIVYFIVDGEPGWVREEPATQVDQPSKPKSWLKRFLGH